MRNFDDLYQRWRTSYRQRLHGSVPELRIQEMARAAALRGDEPPPARPQKPFPIDAATLRKEAEETLGLSWLDELKLRLAAGVIKRKVVGPVMNGNTVLTILGVLAGVLTYLQNALANGTPIPQNAHDLTVLLLGAMIAAIGTMAKAASVGSQPSDPPTKARIAGKLAQGEKVPPEEIVKAVSVSHEVDALAVLKDG